MVITIIHITIVPIRLIPGKIIQTIDKKQQKNITVEDLIQSFRNRQGKDLDNDRMLLGI